MDHMAKSGGQAFKLLYVTCWNGAGLWWLTAQCHHPLFMAHDQWPCHSSPFFISSKSQDARFV